MEFKKLIRNRKLRIIVDWVFITACVLGMIFIKAFILVILGLGVLFIVKVLYQKWGITQTGEILSADDFITDVYKNNKEYCIILRPFGNDNYFKFNNVNAETVVESLLFSTWREVTIEQTIQNVVKSYNPNIETVALVDPKLILVPRSPKFITTSNETWQWVVFDLLKRALWVFIVIPAKTKITDALIWEINKIFELGLVGRFAIVLPPSSVKENKRIIREIKDKLFFISDQLDFVVDGTILIYPNEQSDTIFYYNRWHEIPANKRWRHLKTFPLSTYSEFLKIILKRMNDLTIVQSFKSRYIHQNLEFSEDDYDLNVSKEYLQSYLRKKPNIKAVL